MFRSEITPGQKGHTVITMQIEHNGNVGMVNCWFNEFQSIWFVESLEFPEIQITGVSLQDAVDNWIAMRWDQS